MVTYLIEPGFSSIAVGRRSAGHGAGARVAPRTRLRWLDLGQALQQLYGLTGGVNAMKLTPYSEETHMSFFRNAWLGLTVQKSGSTRAEDEAAGLLMSLAREMQVSPVVLLSQG